MDYSLECGTSQHNFYKIYAAVMIVVRHVLGVVLGVGVIFVLGVVVGVVVGVGVTECLVCRRIPEDQSSHRPIHTRLSTFFHD